MIEENFYAQPLASPLTPFGARKKYKTMQSDKEEGNSIYPTREGGRNSRNYIENKVKRGNRLRKRD